MLKEYYEKRGWVNGVVPEAKLKELQVSEENTRATLKIERSSVVIDQADLDRKRKLLARGTVSQSVVDEEERQLLAQTKKIQDLENALRLLPTQKAAQQEQKAVYEAELEIAKLNLRRTRIRMPFNGRIAEQKVEATQYVGVGETLGTADDIGTSEVAAQFPQSQFRRTVAQLVKLFGLYAIVRLRFDDRDVELRGRVVRISDTVDPDTRTMGVIVAVDRAYASAVPGRVPPLVKGMFVEVELRTRPLERRIVVPRAAVHEGHVYLVDGASRLERRAVEVGLIQGNQTVLTKGVAAGETVVVSDLSPAIDGMLLRTSTDDALARRLVAEASAEGSAR